MFNLKEKQIILDFLPASCMIRVLYLISIPYAIEQ